MPYLQSSDRRIVPADHTLKRSTSRLANLTFGPGRGVHTPDNTSGQAVPRPTGRLPSPARHGPFIFDGHHCGVSKRTAEETEMDPVSIILVGVSAVLMIALFIWSMDMLTALDVRPVASDQ
jgi:hypothetical protein